MKKSIPFLAVLCFLFAAFGGSALAADFQWPAEAPGSDFEFDAESGQIVKYLGKGGIVVIPETIDGAVVKSIKENAFDQSQQFLNDPDFKGGITAVKIPETATNLEPYAFYSCYDLTRIVLPSGLKEIPKCFLYHGSKLTDVIIPKGVTKIGDYAFFHCESLETLPLPDGLKEIGSCAFHSCEKLDLKIPESVTAIGEDAFSYNRTITTLNLPASFTELPDGFLKGCKAVTAYEIPERITRIGKDALNSTGITEAKLPAGLVEIDDGAFAYTKLTAIELPAGVKRIGASAFAGNSAMEIPALPDGLEAIGARAFSECKWTRSVAIPASVKSIGSGVFKNDEYGTVWEVRIPHYEPSHMPELVKKEGEDQVFADVGQISMPWDATLAQTIAMDAWLVSKGEEDIAWTEFNPEWRQYVNFDALALEKIKDGEILVRVTAHKAGEPGEKVAIPRDTFGREGEFLYISEIGDGAFKGQGLSFFGAYASISHIGAEAFADCKELREVFLPISVEVIGERAFANSGISKLAIPESVTEIGQAAFADCKELGEVVLPASVKVIGERAFANSGISKLVISEGVTGIAQTAFAGCMDLESVTLPANLENLRRSHFTQEWSTDAGKFSGATKTIEGTGVTLSYPEGTKAELNQFSQGPSVMWARDEKGVFTDTKYTVYAVRSKTPDTPYDKKLASLLERKEKNYKDDDGYRVFERTYKGHRCIVFTMPPPEASYMLWIYPDDGSHVYISASGDISSVTLDELMNPDVIAVMNSATW